MLIEIKNVIKNFKLKGRFLGKAEYVHAVNDINLTIKSDEILALAGESGCGKSTLGRLCLGLLQPTSGSVCFLGKDIHALSKEENKEFRRKAQIILQDPYASLNPRKTVYQALSQPFVVHRTTSKKQIKPQVERLLTEAGLTPPELFYNRYPHELSGGQRQRICIARSIALNPMFIVADEAVSSLDMSVRAQILNLLKKLQEDSKLSILFITHDLSVIRSVAHRVAVMYLGKLVELAEVGDLFDRPYHPYTEGLLGATPIPKPRLARARELKTISGEPPSPKNIPSGCYFHPRCPEAMAICKQKMPPQVEPENNHPVQCWKYA